jgi:hypothetical protein
MRATGSPGDAVVAVVPGLLVEVEVEDVVDDGTIEVTDAVVDEGPVETDAHAVTTTVARVAVRRLTGVQLGTGRDQ